MLKKLKINKKWLISGLVLLIVGSLFAHGRVTQLIVTRTATFQGVVSMLKAVTVGTDGVGVDVTWFTDTAGEEMLWDASLNGMFLDGTNGANVLTITDGNVAITDNLTITGTETVGSDGSGSNVTWFTDTASEEMLWDAGNNGLFLDGANGSDVLTITDGDFNLSDNASITGTLGVTGVSTLTGGIAYATSTPFTWAVGGATVLATSGTDQAPTNGPRQWVQLELTKNVTLTGIGYLVGSVGGTDSVVVDLYNSAGTAVARSIAADTNIADLVGTAANFQNVDFSSTYVAVAGIYYISIQMNGTTARLRTYPIPGSKFVAATAAGTFKTGASITPGTTFTADEGPISYVY